MAISVNICRTDFVCAHTMGVLVPSLHGVSTDSLIILGVWFQCVHRHSTLLYLDAIMVGGTYAYAQEAGRYL